MTGNWQSHVEDLASISELVIISADISQGLEWEMSFAGTRLNSGQILLSFLPLLKHDRPTKERMYQRFKRQAEPRLDCALPAALDAACLMYLDKDRRARPVNVKGWVWYSKYASIVALRAGLRPMLRDNLGIELKRSAPFWRIMKSFRLAAVCVVATILDGLLIGPNASDFAASLIMFFAIVTAYSADSRARKASLVFPVLGVDGKIKPAAQASRVAFPKMP